MTMSASSRFDRERVRALPIVAVTLGLAAPALLPDTAAAAEAGTYVGAGADGPCVSFKVKKAEPNAIRRLTVGGCDWRFSCGSEGSRGAPSLYARRVRLTHGGRFEIHRTDRPEFGTSLHFDVAGNVRGQRASGTFRFHYGPGCDTGNIRWNAELKQVIARPGGPYTRTRGGSVQLDGSRSKGERLRYTWRVKPSSGCPQGAELAATEFKGARPRFGAVLCGLRVTLTVRDRKGNRDSETTAIAVEPREGARWRVGVELRRETHEYLPVFTPPIVGQIGETLVKGALRCANGWEVRVFCTGPVWWQGQRYKLAQVSDPKGPFHGWYYVESPAPELTLSKVIFLNPYLEPDAPPPDPGEPNWYRYNEERGIPVEGSRWHTIAHEGMGFGGTERSGHMQAMVEAVQANGDHNDPRRYVETRVGPNRNILESGTDQCLDEIDRQIFHYSNDPLAPMKNPLTKFYAWSPGPLGGEWVEAELEHREGPSGTVPIPAVGCAEPGAASEPGGR
jgi:hypothetical protein